MQFIKAKRNFLDNYSHGYFLAKKAFKGKFKREILATIYDPKLKKSCYCSLFLTEKNIIIYQYRNLTDPAGIYEFEINDDLALIEPNTNLESIVNSTIGGEVYKSVSSSYPIHYLKVNNYILLIGILSNLKFGSHLEGAYLKKFLVTKNYREKVQNLLNIIQNILHQDKDINFKVPMHGLSANLSVFNILFGFFCIIGTLLLLIFFILPNII